MEKQYVVSFDHYLYCPTRHPLIFTQIKPKAITPKEYYDKEMATFFQNQSIFFAVRLIRTE
jgi:hypothetical protein